MTEDKRPNARPCNDYGRGACTEKGRAEPGFCICDAMKECVEALKACCDAIDTLNDDALGFVVVDYEERYPLKGELVANARSALAKLEKAT